MIVRTFDWPLFPDSQITKCELRSKIYKPAHTPFPGGDHRDELLVLDERQRPRGPHHRPAHPLHPLDRLQHPGQPAAAAADRHHHEEGDRRQAALRQEGRRKLKRFD